MNVAEKKILCKTLQKQKMLSQLHNQSMSVVTHTTHVKALVGPDSWNLFLLLATTCLRESPATWVKNDAINDINRYNKLMNLVVVNDACERALGNSKAVFQQTG